MKDQVAKCEMYESAKLTKEYLKYERSGCEV